TARSRRGDLDRLSEYCAGEQVLFCPRNITDMWLRRRMFGRLGRLRFLRGTDDKGGAQSRSNPVGRRGEGADPDARLGSMSLRQGTRPRRRIGDEMVIALGQRSG